MDLDKQSYQLLPLSILLSKGVSDAEFSSQILHHLQVHPYGFH